MSRATVPWLVQTRNGRTTWRDLACRTCVSCRSGLPGRCEAPLEPADGADDRLVEIGLDLLDTDLLETAAVAMDLILAGAAAGPAVLLTGAGSRLADVGSLLDAAGIRPLVLHGDVPEGTSLPAIAGGDVRSAFRNRRPSHRPDVVLALDGDLVDASRLVRRGGAIGATGPVTRQPGFAAIVQRELTVLASRDPSAAVRLLGRDRTSELEVVR